MTAIEIAYVTCMFLLSVYGFNNLFLTWVFLRHRYDHPTPPSPPAEWPNVTVQLPVYNELHTVERLLQAAACLDYPRERLEIQLLDDSNDATCDVARGVVHRLREEGTSVVHILRPHRDGFKAGALSAGLAQAQGELLAVFDADFLPEPDFLKRVVPHFSDPRLGCVQTRWGHVNRDYSAFTQAQALGVDGHFSVEQMSRCKAGLFLNFNGTAGVWRRDCITDAGGWTADTLTEDLDLSYRAQLCGWRIHYLPDVVVPAELPAQIAAFKRQQARWAQGSIQTAIRQIPPLLRSSQPRRVKLEGVIHLTGYLVHPLMLIMILLTLPMSITHSWVLAAASGLMAGAVGPPLMYAVAQVAEGGPWRSRLRYLPLLVLLGTGIALSNTQAVLKAVFNRSEVFRRTPKFALHREGDRWVDSLYALRTDSLVWGELGLALFALFALTRPRPQLAVIPWLLMYASGFAYVAGINLVQTYQLQRWLAKQPT